MWGCKPITKQVDKVTGNNASVYTPPEDIISVAGCACGNDRLITTEVDSNISDATLQVLIRVEECDTERRALSRILASRISI